MSNLFFSFVSLLKLFSFILLSLITIPIQALSALIFRNSKKFYIIPKIYNNLVCLIYRIKIRTKGIADTDNHVIFVGNHLSYIDISVIGSTLPATFISKADVRKWPIFGILAILTQTVFIERTREAAARCIKDIKKSLDKGRSLILFPEGTSTQGLNVLPFKSSVFDLFLSSDLRDDILIQPFTISIQKINGHPVKNAKEHDLYAWYGDMTMLPHLWSLGKSTGVELLLSFHPTRAANQYHDRKILAQDCHRDVKRGLENSLPPTLDLKDKED